MSAPITALYASIIGLLLIYLSARVISQRLKKQIGIGDKGDPDMARAIRVQANLIEYAPIALILMFFCETNGLDGRFIHAAGMVLVIGRISHASGLGKSVGRSSARVLGTAATFLVIATLSITNIVRYFL